VLHVAYWPTGVLRASSTNVATALLVSERRTVARRAGSSRHCRSKWLSFSRANSGFPFYVRKKKNLLSWSARSTALCMTRAGPTTRPEDQHG
jgi:hypothetical protein